MPPLAEGEPVAKQAAYDAAVGGENHKPQQKPFSHGGAPMPPRRSDTLKGRDPRASVVTTKKRTACEGKKMQRLNMDLSDALS